MNIVTDERHIKKEVTSSHLMLLSFKELDDLVRLNEKCEEYEACRWLQDVIKAKMKHDI